MDQAPMTRAQLISRIGLKKPRARKRPWQTVTLKYIGASGYLLHSQPAEICLDGKNGGFCLVFKGPIVIPATTLLGDKAPWGMLTDVRLHFGEEHALPDLSLAALMPGLYPQKIVAGNDVVVK